MTLPERIPKALNTLAQRCKSRGGQAVLVGGAVRDHLLQRPLKDWDVEVFGLSLDELEVELRRLGAVNAVGKSFGVFKLSPRGAKCAEIDVSIPRRDSRVGTGHRGIAVVGDPTMSHAEAARRRDLTINSMMLDLLDGTLIDPHGGRADLDAGLLRAVDADTFLEDPLRAVRVVQFAGRFGFEVEPGTLELCERAALDELPPERIQEEWRKLMLRAPRPSVGLAVARQTGQLDRLFPEAQGHGPTDAAVDRAASLRASVAPPGRQLALMLGAWLHTCPLPAVEATLDKLWLHRWGGYAIRRELLRALEELDDLPTDDAGLRHKSVRCELELTLQLRSCARDDAHDALGRAHELGIAHSAPARVLLGRHLQSLGVSAGPRMGKLLEAVYARQLDGDVPDLTRALRHAQRWLDAHPDPAGRPDP